MQATQSSTASPRTRPARAILANRSSPQPQFEPEANLRGLPPSSGAAATIADSEGLLHDARNLIGAMRLYCDLLAQPGLLKPEQVHIPDGLRHLIDRTHSLIERWLEAPSSMPRPEGVQAGPLGELAVHCAGMLAQIAGPIQIRWEISDGAELPVHISAENMERILVNLVRNAVSALDRAGRTNAAGGSIRIVIGSDDSASTGRSVALTVHDTGCGMYACRPLWAAAAGARGHGMGLRIVRELVAAAGGAVSITTKLGAGTSVRLDFPAAAPDTVLASAAVGAGTLGSCEGNGLSETRRLC